LRFVFFLILIVANEKPASVIAGGLGILDLSGRFTSGHGSPPAWMHRDSGDSHDGGGASLSSP
jgi:hypothetical protein